MNRKFRENIEHLIAQVPAGKVTTYGDLASLAGHPYAARVVGGIAHSGDENLPWHRLVNRLGGLAGGYPGGKATQQKHLEAEGVNCTNFIVDDFANKRWRP